VVLWVVVVEVVEKVALWVEGRVLVVLALLGSTVGSSISKQPQIRQPRPFRLSTGVVPGLQRQGSYSGHASVLLTRRVVDERADVVRAGARVVIAPPGGKLSHAQPTMQPASSNFICKKASGRQRHAGTSGQLCVVAAMNNERLRTVMKMVVCNLHCGGSYADGLLAQLTCLM